MDWMGRLQGLSWVGPQLESQSTTSMSILQPPFFFGGGGDTNIHLFHNIWCIELLLNESNTG